MGTDIVDSVACISNANRLATCLILTTDKYRQDVLYVKLPDGSLVSGFDVEREVLSDGSVAFNIILRS